MVKGSTLPVLMEEKITLKVKMVVLLFLVVITALQYILAVV